MKIVYFAPSGFDYASNQMTEGLWLHYKSGSGLVTELICTNKVVHHGSMIEDLPIYDEDYAWRQVANADIILFSSGGSMVEIVDNLSKVIDNPTLARKTVFIDGHDSNAYLVDPARIALYLKRELRYPEANYLMWPNVISHTFGVYEFHMRSEQRYDYDDRDIDISFVAFGGSSPLRSSCVGALKELADRTKLNIVAEAPSDKQPFTQEQYRDIMYRSKIMVNVPGAGIDTLRFWEAMGFGAVLASTDIKDILYVRNLPEARVDAVYFNSWQRMVDVCRAVINSKSWWRMIRANADRLIANHHTTMRRAEQMITAYKSVTA